MTVIAMFPGQSSRYPEMIEKLANDPVARPALDEGSQVLGRDLRAHYATPGDAVFATNRDVQIGVFLANQLHLARLRGAGVEPAWSLGLSLGEYNHLVHIGALDFAAALRLVDARGRLYDEAQGGLMVSVFPLAATETEAVIEQLGLGATVGVGLYNSPRAHVISGERADVERVLAELERRDYFDATVIEPRIPMHAPCFGATARRFKGILDTVELAVPRLPYVPNTLGAIVVRASAPLIRACLADHVDHPVRWQASIDAVAARVAQPKFVEVGPRAVLHNLFGKDWMPGGRAKTDHADRLATIEELRDAG